MCDREGIRTPNPQSRNLIFYPVELRSHFEFGVGSRKFRIFTRYFELRIFILKVF